MEVAGWFVGPVMEKIIDVCFDYLEKKVRWQTNMKTELESLRKNHRTIQAAVLAANKAQISDQNHQINTWIWELRDALDEVNDVLDELEYMKHKEQLAKHMEETKKRSASSSNASFMFESDLKVGEFAFNSDPNLNSRLEEFVRKLVNVSAGVSTFRHLLDSAKQETRSLPTNDLIGRGEAKEFVMQWLTKPSNEPRSTRYRNISVLSIVGHGGMGKTTLLQNVYQDEETTKEFNHKMWVCVSNNFDVKEVIKDILECLTDERPNLWTLEALQRRLQIVITSKKFLLVLDDIWEEEENRDISKWEKVLPPLAYGKIGSRILVTTRMDSVAMKIANAIQMKMEIYKLEGLKEDDCLRLLESHAFAGVENPPDGHKKLRAIAGVIVNKFLGCPLAAKAIGEDLRSKLNERDWRTVLKSNILDQKYINSHLRLSYIVLPNHLQNCFAICCMFPQDHRYDKDDLIRMWIALGFIQPSQRMTMEDIGERYFDYLVKKNLLEKVGDDYKMDDLLHELASKFFAQECGKLVDDDLSSAKFSKTIRHLSIHIDHNSNIIEEIEKFKHLHSLFLFYEEPYGWHLCKDLSKIFKASRSLRLLYIHATTSFMNMIPENIGSLIHLRYLQIVCYDKIMLPRSVSNLYYLQYLIHDGSLRDLSKHDDFLPSEFDDFLQRNMNNLSKLRYMKLPENFIPSICGIGMLKYLQELDSFNVRDMSGYRIGELENMNDLCKLRINCLENVKDAEEACRAKLYAKRRLTDLSLCWSYGDPRNIDLHVYVLDNLQPPNSLRKLRIEHYMGARSAKWMDNVSLLSNLETIELLDCTKWETLPPFGQLPFLKSLKLRNMPKVKWLESKFNENDKCHAFPLLEVLDIRNLEALEDWFEGGLAAEDGCLFPNIIKLSLWDCPKLKELPSLPSKLKRLEIYYMEWTTLNFCSNSNRIPLESLSVCGCPNIHLADEIARLAEPRKLKISNCPNISYIHLDEKSLEIKDPSVLLMEPLISIASLKELKISSNYELVSFPNEAEQWFLKVSSSLCNLEFRWLKSLESLPSYLESLSSLQELVIRDVPMLRELPNLPPSLKSLYIFDVPMLRELPNLPPSLERLQIRGCNPELKERYGKDGGSDHHKIAHISYIYIDP